MRLPKVGDWITLRGWPEYREVTEVQSGFVRVRCIDGWGDFVLNNDWKFCDPEQPRRVPKVGDWVKLPMWGSYYPVQSDDIAASVKVDGVWFAAGAAWQFRDPVPDCAKPIDWSKPVRMKGDPTAEWRVLCTDGPGKMPVLLVCSKDGTTPVCKVGYVFHRQPDGSHSGGAVEHGFENVPPKPVSREVTVYMYRTSDGGVRVIPHKLHSRAFIAQRTITLTEGEGL